MVADQSQSPRHLPERHSHHPIAVGLRVDVRLRPDHVGAHRRERADGVHVVEYPVPGLLEAPAVVAEVTAVECRIGVGHG